MNTILLQQKIPLLVQWIEKTLATHAALARPVSSLNLPRLASYYSSTLLDTARYIPVPQIPVPPLAQMGVVGFEELGKLEADGTTYFSSYFIREGYEHDESLHFHELVHVTQWAHLGTERFITAYAIGHLRHGYRNNPLERMAYELEEVFRREVRPYDVEAVVRQSLDQHLPTLFQNGEV